MTITRLKLQRFTAFSRRPRRPRLTGAPNPLIGRSPRPGGRSRGSPEHHRHRYARLR